jgi:hypothetical protein
MMRRYSAAAQARAAIAGLLLVTAACTRMDARRSVPSITAPSAAVPESSGHTLVIRVYSRGSQSPIAGALVEHELDDHYTNPSGEARLMVAAGEETTIAVSAPEFHMMQASGTLNSNEQWTFYLEADTNEEES